MARKEIWRGNHKFYVIVTKDHIDPPRHPTECREVRVGDILEIRETITFLGKKFFVYDRPGFFFLLNGQTYYNQQCVEGAFAEVVDYSIPNWISEGLGLSGKQTMSAQENKCICELSQLMTQGCKCGQMTRERNA